MVRYNHFTRNVQSIVSYLSAAVLTRLYFTTWVNYLLFHSLAEVFSIVVAFSIFVIAWNWKEIYFFVIHTSYSSASPICSLVLWISCILLPIRECRYLPDYDYYANQLWIGARFMESITLLLAFYFLHTEKMPKADLVFAIYTVVLLASYLSIFSWKTFPECLLRERADSV